MSVLRLHGEPVQAHWVDAYGHLNEAYYLVPFSNATWALQDHFGIGPDYFERTGAALYTLESHLRYVGEVRAPALCEIESQVLALDAKRVVLGHVMKVDGTERATFECVALHYDTRAARSAPFPPQVFAALEAARADTPPEWSGARVSLARPG